MKIYRISALLALLFAGWDGSANAEWSPYAAPAQYPNTNRPMPRYDQHGSAGARVDQEVGPVLTPANHGGGIRGVSSLLGNATPLDASYQNPRTITAPSNAYLIPGAQEITPRYTHEYASTGGGFDGGNAASPDYGAYPPPGYGGVPCPPPSGIGAAGWFGSISGLYMTRDSGNHYLFSFERTNEANQLTNTRDAEMGWSGGFDIRFGHYFNCGQNAVEAVYWGLYPNQATTQVTTDGITQLDGILNWDQLNYNGAAANLAVDDAEVHALFRDTEIQNVEINLLQLFGSCAGGSCGRLNYHWLAGVRYFKFRDHLVFRADTVDRQFTGDPAEIFYDIDLDNNLIGFQFGASGEYCVSQRFSLDAGAKIGLFGNRIQHHSEIGGAAGVAVINNGPNLNRPFLVDSTKNDVTMLAEVNLGAEYCLTDCWTLVAGYRAVAISGVALPTPQIYPDLRGIQDVSIVDSNGSLILHGGYFGAEYNF